MSDGVKERMIELLPRLRRFACALSGDLDRADDLVQETLVRALSHIDQWQPGSRLDSWMYKICQNVWYQRLRTQKVRREVADLDSVPHVSASDGRDVTEGRLTLEVVNRHIARLPEEQRSLIALVCVDGYSYKEAAQILGIPIGTVMSRLSRARQALWRSLEPLATREGHVHGR